ncbi:hypothetical protein ABMA28_001776 [Loxostege sticticalis]|uniref:Peptidase S1 domain-containing protein n=1 Tax=Loxostege sticticalis TaxID=481309 RepID=A0ABD0T5K0_LOXSC
MLAFLLVTLLTYILGHILPILHQISFVEEGPEEHDEYLPRIAYGAPADITDYPYFAGLSGCGGTILSEEWVVTAAHCVQPRELVGDYVSVGGSRAKKSVFVKIEEITVHPYYVPDLLLNDIALIKLAVPLEFKENVQPLKLPDKDEEVKFGSKHVFIGKGRDESGKPSKQLMKMDVNIYPTDDCYRKHFPNRYLYNILLMPWMKNTTICSERVEKLVGAGPGDSGSPIVKDNVLVGIASYATEPGNNRILFLTNVAHYVPWINSVTCGFDSTFAENYFWSDEVTNSEEPDY